MMNGNNSLKERQEKKRYEYRENAITVPMLKADKEIVEAAAKSLGLTNAGFVRMLIKKYLAENCVN